MSTTTNLGHDLSCVTDLDPQMVEVDGRRCLAEAIGRRLITPRGGLIDDPGYGYDLRSYLNSDIDARGLAMIGQGIQAECLKDERVLAAVPAVTFTAGNLVVTISLTDADGPFKLLLVVSAVTVDLLKVVS